MKDNDKAKDAQSAKNFKKSTGALHARHCKSKKRKSSCCKKQCRWCGDRTRCHWASTTLKTKWKQSNKTGLSQRKKIEDGAGAKEGVPATAAKKQRHYNELLDSAQRIAHHSRTWARLKVRYEDFILPLSILLIFFAFATQSSAPFSMSKHSKMMTPTASLALCSSQCWFYAPGQ